MMRKLRSIKVAVLAASLVCVLAVSADAAKRSSVTVKGPSSVKIGKTFSFHISGFAASPANYVSVREAPTSCASTYAPESSKSGPTGQSKNLTPGKSFSYKTAGFKAAHKGKHFLCVYVINFSTIKTYAHASTAWTDHT